jgi:hypothetical protein
MNTQASQALSQFPAETDYGRTYTAPGDVMPELRLPRGWWLLPAVAFGAVGWFALISALFF